MRNDSLGTYKGNGWLRLEAAAQMLGVSACTLRRWADAGKVPHARTPGGQRRFRRQDLCQLCRIEDGGNGRAGQLKVRAGSHSLSHDRNGRPRAKSGSGRLYRARPDGDDLLREMVEVTTSLTRTRDVADASRLLAARLRRVLDVQCCEVFRIQEGELRRLASCDEGGLLTDAEGGSFDITQFPLSEGAARSGEILVVSRRRDPRLSAKERENLALWGHESECFVPLVADGSLIGALDLFDVRPRDFAEFRAFLAGVAQMAAGVFQRALAFEESEAANASLRELVEAGLELGDDLDFERTLTTTADRLVRASKAEWCDIYEVCGTTMRTLLSVIGGAADPEYASLEYEIGDHALIAKAVAEQRPVFTHDASADPLASKADRDSAVEWGYRSYLTLPLTAGGEVIGLAELYWAKAVETPHLDLLRGLSHIAAVALHNAKTYRDLEQRAGQLHALLEAGRAITSAIRLDDVVQTVAASAARTLSCDECVIFEYERETDDLICRSIYQPLPINQNEIGERFPLRDSPTEQRILEQGLAAEESLSDPDLPPDSRQSMEANGEKTCLSVPLHFAGEPVGLMVFIETRVERHFTPEEVDLASGIGEQAAIAIHNSKLYEDVTRAADDLATYATRLQLINDWGVELSSSLDLHEILGTAGQRLCAILHVSGCDMYTLAGPGELRCLASVAEGAIIDDWAGQLYPLDEWTCCRLAVETQEPVAVENLEDARLSAAERSDMVKWKEKSLLVVPLIARDQVIGVVELTDVQERAFTSDEIATALALCRPVALAVANATLFDSLQQHNRETQVLNDVARAAAASLNVNHIAAAAVDELAHLEPTTQGALVVRVGNHFVTAYTSDPRRWAQGARFDNLSPDLLERLQKSRVVTLDARAGSRKLLGRSLLRDAKDTVAVGLLADGAISGVLVLWSDSPGSLSRVDTRLLEGVSTHLSLAINNARLYESVKRMHVGNLKALTSTLSAKDYYTIGHTARVAAYTVLLAGELGWPADVVAQSEEAAYLHDIGKIAVSDRVLLKPGALTDEEWNLMKQHPGLSAEIIEPVLGESIAAAVRHHHERFDGGGYPAGLAGEEIPEAARAMAVVDAYDAMSSRRLYRAPLSYTDCRAELLRCRGSQFDPTMLDAFLAVLDRLQDRRTKAEHVAYLGAAAIDYSLLRVLQSPEDERRREYAQAAAALRRVRNAHPPTRFITVETRAGDHESAVIVDAETDGHLRSPIGERTTLDEDQLLAFEDRPRDINVVYVDQWGVWACGYAPIHGDDDRVAAVVCAALPAFPGSPGGLSGSDVSHAFTSLVSAASRRINRSEVEAGSDALTGLYNHRYVHELLLTEVARANGDGSHLAMVLCDIDGFKRFNDRFGHSAGDDALRSIAHAIERSIRRGDVAARYGGDEFALVLHEADDATALAVAERIRVAVEDRALGPADARITISVGVALLPDDAKTKEELVARADAAMNTAKTDGKNRVVRFEQGSSAST